MHARWYAPAILVAAVAGWLLASYGPESQALQQLTLLVQNGFLAALKMIIVPLIFFSLITGVLQLRKSGGMGRLGGITITYYLGTSMIAIVIGLLIVFFFHPWTDNAPIVTMQQATGTLLDRDSGSVFTVLNNLLRDMLANPFNALAETNILGILVAALLFGMAAAIVLPADSHLPKLLEEITQLVFQVATWVLLLLPLGLFAITYQLTAKIELQTMYALGQFAAVVFAATAFHGLIVLPAIAWLLAGVGPLKFFKAAAQPLITAFITSSSAATLPLSLTTAEQKLGVERAKAAFVLPLGATVNMDGTALFEAIAIIFLAYMFSVPLGTFDIFVVFLVTMLASVGAPGIPSASMAGLQVVMLAVGIPLEGIALLLLIERPLDTFRTAVNVEGDLVGCLVVQRWS
jgi:Na+/H+-dicarboxylate symporter